MASILVVEQEQHSLERISQALGPEGWRVRVAPGRAQALQAAASESPDLVLLSSDVAGADELVRSFMRSAGGPGVILMLPERAEVSSGTMPADERLARPFTDQDLRNVVRRALATKKQGTGPQVRLTSQDIFGDVLAEVESQGGLTGRTGAPAKAPAPAPAAPPAATVAMPSPVAAPPRPRPQSTTSARDVEAIQRKLEETLHGVLGPTPRAGGGSPRKDAGDDNIETLLNKTLSKLEMPARKTVLVPTIEIPGIKPASPPPAKPVTQAAPTLAVPIRPPAAPPARISEPTRQIERPADLRPSPPPPLPPVAAKPAAPAARPAPPAPPVRAPEPPPLVVAAASAAPAAPMTPKPTAPPPISVAPPAAPRTGDEGTGVRKLGRTTGEVDISQLEDLARTRRRSDSSRSGVTPTGVRPIPVPESAAATQRIQMPRPSEVGGEPFGQYTLLEKIAVGGMAEVWKARMRGVEGFQKTVAIKKILPHMTDNAEFVGMFIDEAKLAAQLNHPNIIHIYDLGKISRDYYIAMEFVEGKDLRSLLNAARRLGTPLPLGLALLIAARLADALEYAHNKRDFEGRGLGLVHRDVSPQNVLLSLDGDVKLCDFGIAKAVSKAAQTQMGALKGKLQYMSPEQAWGKPVDQRSDIFSLGAVLFELLTGERLFAGDTEISVLESVRQAKVRSPRQLDPSVPREVDEIVSRALASKPEDRFQSAGEMQQRIEAVLQGLKPQPSHADLAAFVRQIVAGIPREDAAPAPAGRVSKVGTPPAAAVAATSAPDSAAVAPFPPIAPIGEVKVEEGRRGRGLMLGIAATVVLVVGLGYFLYTRKGGATASPGTAGTPAATAAKAAAPPVAPAGAGTAPVDAKQAAAKPNLEGMVDQAVAKQAEAMKQKLEDQKKDLEKKLAQQAEAEKAKKTAAPGGTDASAAKAAATPQPQLQDQAAATQAIEIRDSQRPAATAPSSAPPVAAPASEPAAKAPEPAAETPRRSEPAPPSVKVGDLVTLGPGVVPPELVTVPKPEYPPLARRLKIQGVVVVAILVDENGRVSEATVSESAGKSAGLDGAALAAARGAHYKPGTKEGVRVKMWTRLKVPFTL